MLCTPVIETIERWLLAGTELFTLYVSEPNVGLRPTVFALEGEFYPVLPDGLDQSLLWLYF